MTFDELKNKTSEDLLERFEDTVIQRNQTPDNTMRAEWLDDEIEKYREEILRRMGNK